MDSMVVTVHSLHTSETRAEITYYKCNSLNHMGKICLSQGEIKERRPCKTIEYFSRCRTARKTNSDKEIWCWHLWPDVSTRFLSKPNVNVSIAPSRALRFPSKDPLKCATIQISKPNSSAEFNQVHNGWMATWRLVRGQAPKPLKIVL